MGERKLADSNPWFEIMSIYIIREISEIVDLTSPRAEWVGPTLHEL